MKGANAQAEVSAATKELRRFQVHDVRVDVLGAGVVDEVTRVIRATVR
jgi:16S rRNA (guanine527-N7)-methyltransferase